MVTALLRRRPGTVGITTALQGAGGFGKTTLAQVVCTDRRVRHRFSGGVFPVTVGRDARGAAAMATKINDVIQLISGEDATFTDPELAGRRLAALMESGPRRLLVLDDVWEPGQLAPFVAGGKRCARLVTTRDPGLLAGRGVAVRVDQMSPGQARALLASGLPMIDPVLVGRLLDITGRWPLLLRLINKILANAVRAGADVGTMGAQLLQELQSKGPGVIDSFSRQAGKVLDVSRPEERAQAVRATIGASTGLLDPKEAECFAELGVFAEDETIPFKLLAKFWKKTTNLNDLQTSQLCGRLSELGLVSTQATGTGGIALHDVIRDFLRFGLGPQRLAELNGVLIDAVAADLPTADALDTVGSMRVAWWALGSGERYMQDHLIEHLIAAGRRDDAEMVAGDLRWVGARLGDSGPVAPVTDLSRVGTQHAVRLRAALTRAAHLLAPTEPTYAVVDVLHSRVAGNPEWSAQVNALRNAYSRPRLVNRWAPPDLPDPALLRILTVDSSDVQVVTAAPDGNWLAIGSSDGTVRLLDAITGQESAVILANHRKLTSILGGYTQLSSVAIAPDGTWLAIGGNDGTVRIWDTVTKQDRSKPARYRVGVAALAIAPDGTWLAIGGNDGTVRIKNSDNGRTQVIIPGYGGRVCAMAVSPDDNWLAIGSDSGMVRIWNAASGQRLASLVGHGKAVKCVAVAPDGSWVATGSSDGTVRIWDTATWRNRAILSYPEAAERSYLSDRIEVVSVAVAPDSSWLAAAGSDGTVRIWNTTTDTATWHERVILRGHPRALRSVAVAPDGSWLATGDRDGTVRIWDSPAREERTASTANRHDPVSTVSIAQDGTWLATGGRHGREIQVWDAATRPQRRRVNGNLREIIAVGATPDGTWLATKIGNGARIWDRAGAIADSTWLATEDGFGKELQIWNALTGSELITLVPHSKLSSVAAIAPNGKWFATQNREEIQIREMATGYRQTNLPLPSKLGYIVAVAFDGSWLATRSRKRADSKNVQIWDTATGHQRAVLAHRGDVSTIAIAPDSKWIATEGKGGVQISDTATGHQRAVLAHRGDVSTIAIAPDGKWIATGGKDGTVCIWNSATCQPQALMRVENSIFVCAWLDATGLVVGGEAGLYLFDFLRGNIHSS